VAELRDGVLYLRWVRGAVVEEADARAAKTAISALCSAGTCRMLVDLATMAWVGRKAQDILSEPGPVTRKALLGSSPVDHVIAYFYLARHSPPCPTRFFTSFQEALAWLGTPAPGKTEPTLEEPTAATRKDI
jgi:hypothetical protein